MILHGGMFAAWNEKPKKPNMSFFVIIAIMLPQYRVHFTGCPNEMYRICFANNFHTFHRILSIHASNDSAILGDLLTLPLDGLASVWGSRERVRQVPCFGDKIQQENWMPICTQI